MSDRATTHFLIVYDHQERRQLDLKTYDDSRSAVAAYNATEQAYEDRPRVEVVSSVLTPRTPSESHTPCTSSRVPSTRPICSSRSRICSLKPEAPAAAGPPRHRCRTGADPVCFTPGGYAV